MSSEEHINKSKNDKQNNFVSIISDDKNVKDYFELLKQYNYIKKQHALKIKLIKNNYKKNIIHLNNKYKIHYNIINKDYNKTLNVIQNKFKSINTYNIFYKQLTNYMEMLYKKYDINLIFRAFYFSFLLDIYIMVQFDRYVINLNKLTEKQQKEFINRVINHLIQFYNGYVPKKEYKFYSLDFTTKHFNDDNNFSNEDWNEYKNNKTFLIFYNICYNLHFIRREIVWDFIKLDEIFDNTYEKLKPLLNKSYFKNNFWINNFNVILEDYVNEIRGIYRKYCKFNIPFDEIYLIYIFSDVLYKPPKENYYGFNNDFRLTNYFISFLNKIPYNDFYFTHNRTNLNNFDNENNLSDEEDDEIAEDDDVEEDDDEE